MAKKTVKKTIENGKILFYQSSANEIIDLGDELSLEEIGYYLIIKNVYIKYCGKIDIENLPRYCKIFNPHEQKKLKEFAKSYFQNEKIIQCSDWDEAIGDIVEKSEKATKSAEKRWKNNPNACANEYANAYANGYAKVNVNVNVNEKDKVNEKENEFLGEFFEKFRIAYPKWISPVSTKEFKEALKIDTFENIMLGLEKYKSWLKKEKISEQYTKNAENWLTEQLWKKQYGELDKKPIKLKEDPPPDYSLIDPKLYGGSK